MASFLINCSNLKAGGGLQVADSVCRQLIRYPQHSFIVVTSSVMRGTREAISSFKNVKVIEYDICKSLNTLLLGHDHFLEDLVTEEKINAVLTVFGPSRWRPRVPHLCGFARAQLLLEDPLKKRKGLKDWLTYKVWKWAFCRSSDTFYTENAYITRMLPSLIKGAKVYTVSNYYNQVFDQPERWVRDIHLPSFDGTTLLTISTPYSHKNFDIAIDAAAWLRKRHPDFQFRFVMTATENQMKSIPDELKKHFILIGKVDVAQCPYLYEQSDIMFMPTLLECFTATYPEAMRMEKPIVTTDLEFARGLCADAACYYSAVDAEACAAAIYKVARDKEYAQQLVENGRKQLLTYDNYEQRADKLVRILEEMAVNKRIEK